MCEIDVAIIYEISHSDSFDIDMIVPDNAPDTITAVNDNVLYRSMYRHFRDLTVFRRYDTEDVHLR